MSNMLYRGMSRRDFMRLAAIFGAGVAASPYLAGCSPAPGAPAQADGKPTSDKPRGTITIAQGADLTSTDPHQTQGSAPRAMVGSMFDPLVMFDHDFNVIPWLATSWKLVNDTTWEFKLRNDVKFHNGQDLTAEDVEWSVQRFVDPETKNIYASTLKPVVEMKIPDPYTIQMITEKPFPFLAQNMALYFFIAPKKAMQDMGDAYFENPIGSGPHEFVEWIPGDRVVHKAGKPHFSGLPLMEKVIWRTITESATKITGIKTGELDMIDGVAAERIKELQDTAGVNVVEQYRQSNMVLVMNCAEKPFNDKRVRQAMNYAVDKEAIINHVLFGAGRPTDGPIHRIQEGYNPDLKPYPYDPQKAKELLAAAGYPDGFSFQFDTPAGRYPKDKEVAEAVAGQWREIGINASVNTMEWGAFVKAAQEKSWKVFLISQGPYSSHLLLSSCFSSRTKGLPWLNYQNDEIDDLIDAVGSEMDDAKRAGMIQKAGALIHDDCPWVFLHNFPAVFATRDRVQGWKPGNEIIMLFDTWLKG